MSLTIELLAAYLGRPVSEMLSDAPFREWPFKRSVDADLDPPRIDYTFANDGLDIVCDQSDKVATIFLHFDEHRQLSEKVKDLPLSSNRQDIIQLLGTPTKKGNGMTDPILGKYGPWDRFSRDGHMIHVEYHPDIDRIQKVSLMCNDVAPA